MHEALDLYKQTQYHKYRLFSYVHFSGVENLFKIMTTDMWTHPVYIYSRHIHMLISYFKIFLLHCCSAVGNNNFETLTMESL